jgi:hypothetical protein
MNSGAQHIRMPVRNLRGVAPPGQPGCIAGASDRHVETVK